LTTLVSLLEVNLAKYLHPSLSFTEILLNYEEFSNNEYPKIGEIITLNGFSDW